MSGRYGRRPLSRVVNEAIRLGLAYVVAEPTGTSVCRTFLAASLVHRRCASFPGRPACGGPSRTIKRFRLVDDLTLVDCQGCVDRSNSGILDL